jgi:hypothetical protein
MRKLCSGDAKTGALVADRLLALDGWRNIAISRTTPHLGYALLMMLSRTGNTALAIWFGILCLAMLYVASLPGPFYPRHSRPGSKPIPLWRARAFAILLALWALFGSIWMLRHR